MPLRHVTVSRSPGFAPMPLAEQTPSRPLKGPPQAIPKGSSVCSPSLCSGWQGKAVILEHRHSPAFGDRCSVSHASIKLIAASPAPKKGAPPGNSAT